MNQDKKQQIFIFSTLIIPAIAIIIWWSLLRLYVPEKIQGQYDFVDHDSSILASDGSGIFYSYIKSQTNKKNPLVLFVSDRSRDREWNTKGLSPRIASRLALMIGRLGYDSIRFDNRGTGKSNASLQTHYNLDLIVRDIRNVYIHTIKNLGYEPKNILLLAHGDGGCSFALEAMKKIQAPSQIMLINCSPRGSYLHTWGRRILVNMKHKGVPQKTITQAKSEWKLFLQTNKVLPVNKKTHPDVTTFRNTMSFLLEKNNKNFRKQASNIHLSSNIKNLLAMKVMINHFQSEFDNELLGEEISFIKKHTKQYKSFETYHFHYLKNTDHLLRNQTSSQDHLFALLQQNLNPFVKINKDFLGTFKSILLNIN